MNVLMYGFGVQMAWPSNSSRTSTYWNLASCACFSITRLSSSANGVEVAHLRAGHVDQWAAVPAVEQAWVADDGNPRVGRFLRDPVVHPVEAVGQDGQGLACLASASSQSRWSWNRRLPRTGMKPMSLSTDTDGHVVGVVGQESNCSAAGCGLQQLGGSSRRRSLVCPPPAGAAGATSARVADTGERRHVRVSSPASGQGGCNGPTPARVGVADGDVACRRP